MDRKSLLDRLDERACLDVISMMVQHKSYSGTEGETVLVKRMVDEMNAVGIDAHVHHFGDAGRCNAVGTIKGTGGGKSLIYNGHLDTNPVTEGWTVDPWGGLVDDKFIYGIGVSNMKASDAAFFCAARALQQAGVRLKGDVILTFVVGELQGGVGTEALLKDGLKADYFINGEPSDLVAVTMHSEALKFQIELTGDIVAAINAAYREVRGEDQPTGAISPTRFYGSDAGHLYKLGGMEGIVCGCGGRYNTMPDERVDIVDYIDLIKVYILAMMNICGVEGDA